MFATPSLLLHRSLEKRGANNLNELYVIWCVYLGSKHILLPPRCLQNPNEPLKQVGTLPFPCLSFPLSLSVKYYPMTFYWLASIKAMDFLSWTEVRLQCKNNKGKMNVLPSSLYSPQTSAFGVTLYSGLSHAKSLKTQFFFFFKS